MAELLKLQYPLNPSGEPIVLGYNEDLTMNFYINVNEYGGLCEEIGLSISNPKIFCMGEIDTEGQLILDKDSILKLEDWPDW